MKKKKAFLIALFSFISVFMLSFMPVHAARYAADSQDVSFTGKIDSQTNLPTWTTIVNQSGDHYGNLTIESGLVGHQNVIPKTIKVEYGHMTNGKFVVDSTDDQFDNYQISGNLIKFKFNNVSQTIRISYSTYASQTGTLSNGANVTEDGTAVNKTGSCNLLGYGYLFSDQTASSSYTNGVVTFAAVPSVSGTSASDATITDANGKVLSHTQKLSKYRSYNVTWSWSIPNSDQIKAGDTIDFDLPSNVQVDSDITFNVTQGVNGQVIGTFTIKKGAKKGTLTFNNYLQNHPETNRHGVISIEAIGTEKDTEDSNTWHLNKVGWVNSSNQPTWNVVVNPQGAHYDSVTITDTMANGQEIIPDSIVEEYGHYNSNGQFVVDKEVTNPTNYTISGNKITFNFKNIDSPVQIVYNTKADQSGILKNSVVANVTDDTGKDYSYTNNAQISYSGKGTMNGDTPASSSSSSSNSSSSKSSLSSSSNKKASSSSVKSSSSSKNSLSSTSSKVSSLSEKSSSLSSSSKKASSSSVKSSSSSKSSLSSSSSKASSSLKSSALSSSSMKSSSILSSSSSVQPILSSSSSTTSQLSSSSSVTVPVVSSSNSVIVPERAQSSSSSSAVENTSTPTDLSSNSTSAYPAFSNSEMPASSSSAQASSTLSSKAASSSIPAAPVTRIGDRSNQVQENGGQGNTGNTGNTVPAGVKSAANNSHDTHGKYNSDNGNGEGKSALPQTGEANTTIIIVLGLVLIGIVSLMLKKHDEK